MELLLLILYSHHSYSIFIRLCYFLELFLARSLLNESRTHSCNVVSICTQLSTSRNARNLMHAQFDKFPVKTKRKPAFIHIGKRLYCFFFGGGGVGLGYCVCLWWGKLGGHLMTFCLARSDGEINWRGEGTLPVAYWSPLVLQSWIRRVWIFPSFWEPQFEWIPLFFPKILILTSLHS